MTKFALHWRIPLALGSVFLIGCGNLLGEADRPVELEAVWDRVLFSPQKEYARAWAMNGSCTVIMVVDPVSGKVTGDYLEFSSGNDYLNRIALEMLRDWKFKPGSPHLVRTTFAFGDAAWRNSPEDRHSQPMNKVLEPFLGKNALKQGGDLPDYPRDIPWTNKHGTGVFNLHVSRTGEVTGVSVKKPSGDAPFDELMVRTTRQWRFRKGPIEIELPLYFALTPEKFSIRIPKYP